MKGSGIGLRLLAAAVISLTLIATSDSAGYRLSNNVWPSFYNLTINIQGDTTNPGSTFDGEVAITLQTNQSNLQEITLHKDALDISSCSLYNQNGLLQQSVATSSLIFDQETQQLTVSLSQALTANENYTLHFQFTGTVRTDLGGLFSASYVEPESGKTKWVLLTQMQRINARLVFPCFDEPALKAQFEVHIGRPNGFNSISNTRLKTTTSDAANNRYVDHFEVTPLMSTYLLAFVISEYSRVQGDTELALYSRPENINKTTFSYQVGQLAVAAYNEIFQLPYQQLGNDVLQFTSSPRFPHNGMENWGLIIYSDAVLVQDAGYTDGLKDLEFTTRIVVHEVSHMWFGDSVTFSWWSYFWLNEAFARYYEYFMTHQLSPEYQLDQQFVVRQLQLILRTDAVASTQPMTSLEANVQTPAQIANKFSSIAYAKGASIVRMWRNIMGGENFEKSINSYLKEYHLNSTQPSDLFAHLKQNWPAQPAVDLDEFFTDFTEQEGYPMITVNFTEENHRAVLRQKRFLSNPGDGSNATILYTIPITFATNLKPNFQNMTPGIYFRKNITQVQLNSQNPLDWIILNVQQSNYYRVLYDTPILNNIQLALAQSDHSSIAVENRAQLIDDLFNFAYAKMLDYAEVFQFIEYLSKEVHYIPWYAAYTGMERVAKRLTPHQLTNFETYLKDITAAVYAKLTVNSKDYDVPLDVYNREMQVSWLCKYQNTACNNDVKISFERNVEQPSPDYRETFYCAAARTTGYARVLELYQKETNSAERELLWRAASCTREYRNHYTTQILGNSTTVAQKTAGLAQMYEQNPDLITAIFSMITEDIQLLYAALGSWSTTAEVLSDLADYFTTSEQEQQLSEFVDKNSALFGDAASTLKTAQSTVSTNLQWADQRLGKLVNFLASRNSAAGLTINTTFLMLMSALISLLLKKMLTNYKLNYIG
ncbi:aminopeptidase N-like [Drosophila sulfurigaster albostrigata]|uniref:aminopeptidase N-like n=1 Tax=Drosophila sulfurigaster albostrigata TaxID=89887 RepID=UPI002D2195EE|nr:aminopeptidase N-like [Drosophila sulfurigaster albostrigata]